MSNRITFDANINTRPFQSYIEEMRSTVDTFFDDANSRAYEFAEQLGALGSDFEFPELDFSVFDSEKINAFAYSLDGLVSKFGCVEQSISAVTESLAHMDISGDIAKQFDAVEESASGTSLAFEAINDASIVAHRGLAMITSNLDKISENFVITKRALSNFGEKLKNLGSGALDIISNNFMAAKEVLSNFGRKLQELGSGALGAFRLGLDKVKNSMVLAKAKTKLLAAKTKVLTAAKAAFNLVAKANPIGLIIAAVAALVAGIVLLIKNWDTVKEAVLNFVDTAMEWLGKFTGWIGDNVTGPIAEGWGNLWGGISEGANRLLGNIQEVFGPIAGWMKSNVTALIDGDWAALRENLMKGFENVGNFIRGVFERLPDPIKNVINGLIRFINGMVQRVVNGLNAVIGGLNSVGFDLPSWLGGGSFRINIPKISAPQIPELARGGIVDRPTLALIGERGKEAVMPLENNTGWITDLANSIGAVVGAQLAFNQAEPNINSTLDSSRPMQLYLDGRKVAEGIMDDFVEVARQRDIQLSPVFV